MTRSPSRPSPRLAVLAASCLTVFAAAACTSPTPLPTTPTPTATSSSIPASPRTDASKPAAASSSTKAAGTPSAAPTPAATAPAEAPTAPPPAATTGAATAPAEPTQAAPAINPLDYLGMGAMGRAYYWSSPSGNVVCGIDVPATDPGPHPTFSAGCQATVPVADSNCGDDPATNATFVSLSGAGLGGRGCSPHGQFVSDTPAKVLPYGSSISAWRTKCTSEPSGMTCTDLGTGQGFSLNREAATLTPGGQTPVEADVDVYKRSDEVGLAAYFTSPSGNFVCRIGVRGDAEAACQATTPVAGTQCGNDPQRRATITELTVAGTARQDCTTQGMTVINPPIAILPYGYTIGGGGRVSCTSAPEGITCTDNSTGRSFTIAREGVRLG